jgi:very-short-patch-repair endonuclease
MRLLVGMRWRPQVYLHYDPYTRYQRGKQGPLKRQRMDFLLLLPHRHRVVIEVDGRQHYADENGVADTSRYAEMVKEDRALCLAGYEVYRFGGKELMDGDISRDLVRNFFTSLMRRYDLT